MIVVHQAMLGIWVKILHHNSLSKDYIPITKQVTHWKGSSQDHIGNILKSSTEEGKQLTNSVSSRPKSKQVSLSPNKSV